MNHGRVTPTFQLQTVKGQAMKPALLAGLGVLERPEGEACFPQLTDNQLGLIVCVERQKRVTVAPRWSVALDLDAYDNEVYKYRTVFAFESETEADIVHGVRQLLSASK